jgi:hypothetical protein
VNNVLACINTKLLADYCAIDPRLAPLVALVKHWAKRRSVNDPYRGTLSSYCYVLMCIHLLQMRPTPVLPVLQQLPPTFRRTVGPWTCEFCDDVSGHVLCGVPPHLPCTEDAYRALCGCMPLQLLQGLLAAAIRSCHPSFN